MSEDLEQLEKKILEYYQNKGLEVGVGTWGFKICIETYYKEKSLRVSFYDGLGKPEVVFYTRQDTVQKMYKDAFLYFVN